MGSNQAKTAVPPQTVPVVECPVCSSGATSTVASVAATTNATTTSFSLFDKIEEVSHNVAWGTKLEVCCFSPFALLNFFNNLKDSLDGLCNYENFS